jgi:hypothetical protein
LSDVQFSNTVRELVAATIKDSTVAGQVMTAIAPRLTAMPASLRLTNGVDPRGNFRRIDQDVSQAWVDAAMDVAFALATELTTPARLGALMGTCATDTNTANDEACLTAFISAFGARALRSPLSPEDVAFYRKLYGTTATMQPLKIGLVVAAILSAPKFLYRVEQGTGASVAPRVYSLSQYELASRLSYHLWDGPPDELLLAAAASDRLSGSGLEQQVDRMIADPKGTRTTRSFFREWLRLDGLPNTGLLSSNTAFRAFAGADLPDASFRQAIEDDALMLVDDGLSQKAPLTDVFTSTRVFPRSELLARIYGVPVWSPGAPASTVEGRPGVFTRAALLYRANAIGSTNPIQTGVTLRTGFLCDTIGTPPDDAQKQADATAHAANATKREIVELSTQTRASCAGCHKTQINPLGFVFQGFDGLGRARTVDRVFDETDGKLIGESPVNSTAAPHVRLDDETVVSTPAELMGLMAESGKLQACAARQYFRFTFARSENVAADGCTLESLRQQAGSSSTLPGFIRTAVLDPAFLQRSFDE